VSTHPESHFVSTLMAARPTPDRRYVLRDNELTVHHSSGVTERRTFTRAADLRRVLEHDLGIRLPRTPDLEATLQRIASGPGKSPSEDESSFVPKGPSERSETPPGHPR
jgi:N-hydroxyarylamine O-acetyltransferase